MAVGLIGKLGGAGRLQIATLNSNGYPTGTAGPSPANGTTSHAYLCSQATAYNLDVTAPDKIEWRGADRITGSYQWGGAYVRGLTIDVESLDNTLNATLNGSNVDSTTNSLWYIGGTNPNQVTLPTTMFVFSQIYQSAAGATTGQNQFMNFFFPSVTAVLSPGSAAYRSANSWSIQATPTMGARLPWGTTFGANQNFADNQTNAYWIITNYPLAITTFISDAVATTFVSGYRPISTVVALGANNNLFARNGTAQALTSTSTTTGVNTMVAAGTGGDVNIDVYETNFQAI